ncbi:MAG: 3-phosphoglycerate dehydrogenase [Bacteroidales bacterium]|jgi:D-3-phosphoglycerate dehydrogenase|nr:3-phosphoglycerate dehydrogenase [Bacteroidales bacterium]
MKILVATEKPFAKAAIQGIREIVEKAGHSLTLLEKYGTEEVFALELADKDALIVRSDKVTAMAIANALNLKIVVRAGAGYDNLDLPACTARGIVAMNTPGQNANAVAELAIGMMIYLARNQFQPGTGSELRGKKLGIHAYGNVGRGVAWAARGLGMEVFAFDPFVPAEKIKQDGVCPVDNIETLYNTCHYISLHIPANEQTKKSIGYDLLSRMPKGATLINTARKEVIHEEDLLKIMEERADFKYGTDILPDNKEVFLAKFGTRFFGTPKKMGAETAEANVNAGLAAATQIVNFFQNGDTTFQVNK